MRVLFVTPEWPYPPDQGGRARMFNFLKLLSREYSIQLVSVVDSPPPVEYQEALRPYLQATDTLYHPNSMPRTSGRMLRSLATGRPYILDRYCPSSLSTQIDLLNSRTSSHAIFLAAHYLTNAVAPQLNIPVVIDFHDITHVLYERFAQSPGLSLKKWHGRVQWRRMREFEAGIPRHASVCTTASLEDAATLKRISGAANIHVIPNGVDTEFNRPESVTKSAPCFDVLFVGSFGYAPNIQAARFLCADVMPRVWQVIPAARVGLVGREPAPAVRQLARDARVQVTGRVPDVRPYLVNAALVVVPLLAGSGTRLKILEAMSMTKAVVSTTIGCEGLQVTDGVNIAIADTPQQLAETIIRLLHDPAECSRLGQAARRVAETVYDWKIVGQQLLSVMQMAVFPR